MALLEVYQNIALQHFSGSYQCCYMSHGKRAADRYTGFHFALDMRTALPRSFLAYYPSLYDQDSLQETATIIVNSADKIGDVTIQAGHPPRYEPCEDRENYDTSDPLSLTSLGYPKIVRLGDVALARSGDKGSNLNCGIFVKDPGMWDWLRSYLSRERMKQLMGDDWSEEYFMERVEFPNIFAVHFVVYGILGRGVSGSTRLDCLGKGFADYIRDKLVEVPSSGVQTNGDH